MRIVCVYRSGGPYDIRYVVALKNALIRYCKEPFDFYCLTNEVKEVEPFAIPVILEHNLSGWWSKIELFNPKLFSDKETVLYFDLDVLILKDISKLIEVCREDRSFPIMLRSRDKVGVANDWPASSIMSWSGKKMHRVWYEFFRRGPERVIEAAQKETALAGQRTDQGFIRKITQTRKFQDVLPKQYFAFKYDYWKDPKVFETATILNWTGRPRLNKIKTQALEIRLCWRERCKIIGSEKKYVYETY